MAGKNAEYGKKILLSEIIAIGFGFPVAAAYVLILLNMSFDTAIKVLIFATIVAILVELLLAQPTNLLVSRKVRQGVKDWDDGKLKDCAAIQSLFAQLHRLPLSYGILIFARIVLGSTITIFYMGTLGIPVSVCLMASVLSSYGSYLAGVLAFVTVTKLNAPVAEAIIASGSIPEDVIAKKRFFSLPVLTKNIFFLFVPVVVTNLSIFFCVWTAGIYNTPFDQMMVRLVGDLLVSVATMAAFMILSTRMITAPLASLEKSLVTLSSGAGDFSERIPTGLGDDFAYIAHLMNKAIDNFQEVITKVKGASFNLNSSIQDLNVSTQEISATSNQQAAGVKEIISTMEDSDQLSKRVAAQANEVARIAEGTKEVVATGFGIIKESLDKMDSIKEANAQSIRGIKELGDKIERIWDIVNIINGIADQTKIIAFNAELEAASAGEAGKSFQIVATEIRRLADGTVNSTSEIKSRINEMQNSSDHLILSSEEGTTKIIAGWELSNKLRTLFEDILKTSEISSDSAQQIAGSIDQQVVAFDQILVTLKQISAGIDNFVTSTASTSKLTRVLMDMSVDLHQVVVKYGEHEQG
jgi:methyl-accepting chemotaxis protein